METRQELTERLATLQDVLYNWRVELEDLHNRGDDDPDTRFRMRQVDQYIATYAYLVAVCKTKLAVLQ